MMNSNDGTTWSLWRCLPILGLELLLSWHLPQGPDCCYALPCSLRLACHGTFPSITLQLPLRRALPPGSCLSHSFDPPSLCWSVPSPVGPELQVWPAITKAVQLLLCPPPPVAINCRDLALATWPVNCALTTQFGSKAGAVPLCAIVPLPFRITESQCLRLGGDLKHQAYNGSQFSFCHNKRKNNVYKGKNLLLM